MPRKFGSVSSRRGAVGTLALAVVIVLGSLGSAGALTREVQIRFGDKVTGTLSVGGDVAGIRFFAVEGAKVSIVVARAKGSTLEAAVALKNGDGDILDLGKSYKPAPKKTKVTNFVISQTGYYTFEVSATAGTGDFVAATKGTLSAKVELAGTVPGTVVLPFFVEPGSTLKGSVKAAKGSSLMPTIDSLSDSVGPLVLDGLKASKGTAKFKSATTDVGGLLTLTVGGSGTGQFAAKLKVKTAKSKVTVAAATGRDTSTEAVAEKVNGEPATTDWSAFRVLKATVRSDEGLGSTGHVYGGEFNMTGSKDGLAPFPVDVRAAYDETYLYMRFRWPDATQTNDVHRRRWYFNPAAPGLPDWDTQFPNLTTHPKSMVEQVPTGWSSNLNDDKFAVAWAIGDPAGITTNGLNEANLPAGTSFAQAGCAVACHGNLGMAPPSGLIDLWHWKTSRSNPLGYVNDQWGGNGSSRSTDTNQTLESRNRVSTNTSGPAKVLNPVAANVVVNKTAGTAVITFDSILNGSIALDGRLFLTADAAMPIESTDAVGGATVFASTCQTCHGVDGKGAGKDLAKTGLTWTRAEIVAKANNVTPHGGGDQGLDGVIISADTDKLIARIRAFAGAPGYTLSENNGANFAVDDITAVRNFENVYDPVAGEYTVIVRRKLTTADTTQDVQFADLTATYLFGVAVMDFDGQNHAGAPLLELSFD
jgi:mono/diheme cytochrome c family protein